MGIEILNYVDTVDQFFGLCVKIRELVRVELEVAAAARISSPVQRLTIPQKE